MNLVAADRPGVRSLHNVKVSWPRSEDVGASHSHSSGV